MSSFKMRLGHNDFCYAELLPRDFGSWKMDVWTANGNIMSFCSIAEPGECA